MQIDVTDEQHSTNKTVRFKNLSPGFINQNVFKLHGAYGNPWRMISFMINFKLGY